MASNDRTIFGVMVDPAEPGSTSGQLVMTPSFTLPVDTPLSELVAQSIGMLRFFRAQHAAPDRPDGVPPEAAPPPEPNDYEIFDAQGERLAHDSTVGGVPRPGAIVLVARAIEANGGHPPAIVAMAAWRQAEDSPAARRFMASSAPDVEPLGSFRLDVFLSYAAEDEATAADLHQQLGALGLRVFLASKSIDAGADWSDTLREALRSARMVVVLLTPASIRSPWVMCEAGACWALGKPVVPAVAYVKPGRLPGPLGQYQARPASSPSQIAALAREVATLCRGGDAPPPVSGPARQPAARRRRAATGRGTPT